MPAKYVEKGYGQVEPNRLTAPINGDMESQAPALTSSTDATPISQLENGSFLILAADVMGVSPLGRIALVPGEGAATDKPFMVFSERKVYDERQSNCDFVLDVDDIVDGTIYPRLFGMTPGDTYTTNTINEDVGSIALGDTLYIGDDGLLSKTQGTNKVLKFTVIKVYTMPDAQAGIKVLVENFTA